ncbi:hypothetical protein [Kaistella palustris]|uniref:hypothetical protein n=1 Tax=Kaistella palustris TaxID=493376 RepID=UPI0003F7C38A|nr:hypothetical protein [Kaistella palustris]
MKKTVSILATLFFAFQTFAQDQKYDWKNMKPEQRKQTIQKMNPQQRMLLLQQFRENMVVSEIAVPKDDQEQFKTLYAEYQAKQNEIKKKFKTSESYENMSDEEATNQLNQSFEIGQQLLDNRKIYAEKFMKVIKPQQVLQMYQTEGKLRNKMLDRKQDGPRNSGPQSRRP